MRFIILFLLLSPLFSQDGTYDKIIKDHDSAVKEIFDKQIVDCIFVTVITPFDGRIF